MTKNFPNLEAGVGYDGYIDYLDPAICDYVDEDDYDKEEDVPEWERI